MFGFCLGEGNTGTWSACRNCFLRLYITHSNGRKFMGAPEPSVDETVENDPFSPERASDIQTPIVPIPAPGKSRHESISFGQSPVGEGLADFDVMMAFDAEEDVEYQPEDDNLPEMVFEVTLTDGFIDVPKLKRGASFEVSKLSFIFLQFDYLFICSIFILGE